MNFLSITFDDMNAFAFMKETYPGVLHTPNIDRLMGMGTTFENAFAQVAVCGASRASALSGLNPGLTGVHMNFDKWENHLDASTTFPAVLKQQGYETTIIGKVFHNIVIDPSVVDVVADRTFISGQDGRYNHTDMLGTRPMPKSDGPDGDFLNTSEAIRVLNQAGSDPFALFLGIIRPHLGWVVPQEYFDLYPLDEIKLPFVLDGDINDIPPFMQQLLRDDQHTQIMDADFWKGALQGYFASISYADAMLGRVLDTLEKNGQLEDTAILLWTDHGYHLGDKDNWHKFTLWEEAARAPFVLALPGSGDNGHRVEQVVEMVDMMPTVLDLLGIDAPDGLSGRSLRPFLDNPARLDGGTAITTMYGSAAIRTNDYRYIRYADGSTELYQIDSDPNQWVNLAAQPQWQSVRADLDAKLRSELVADGWIWVEPGRDSTGSGAGDLFVLEPGSGRATGGGGDDTYFITTAGTQIVEGVGGGEDTVYTSVDYKLPDHVENIQQQVRTARLTLLGNPAHNSIIGAGRLEGRGGNDVLQGNSSSDFLDGGDGNDILRADSGNDRLSGGLGNDLLSGGVGSDAASYAGASAGVTVNLGTQGAQDTRAAGLDTLVSIENVVGSSFADNLTGTTEDNIMEGGAGNDLLFGGHGRDTASYASAAQGVVVTLRLQHAQDTLGAGTDILRDFENLQGSEFDDRLEGTGASNSLDGLGSNDYLAGGEGDDALSGGTGNDLLDGGSGFDAMSGGLGNDVYMVDATFDRVIEGINWGIDQVRTSLSSYTLGLNVEQVVGLSAAGQVLRGNLLANTLQGGAGADTLSGGLGNDLLDGGAGLDSMSGGAGNDAYVVDASGDRVVEASGMGEDEVRTSLSSYVLGQNLERLIGLSSTGQVLTGNLLANTLQGGAGADILDGGLGNDLMDGGAGIDTVTFASSAAGISIRLGAALAQDTGAGMDSVRRIENVIGSAHNDVLLGSTGSNRLHGARGNDEISAGRGRDVLLGGAGADILDGGLGDDLMDGGAGIDTVSFASSAAGVSIRLGATIAQKTGSGMDSLRRMENVIGSAHDDVLLGSIGNNRLHGARGNDQLSGGRGQDALEGGVGADILNGGFGNDRLDGGAGHDVLFASDGRDSATGGAGADTFVFQEDYAAATRAEANVITDFSRANGDRIELRAMDAIAATGADDRFLFLGKGAFTGVAGQLRYTVSNGNTFVQGDTNGDRVADFYIRLDDSPTLLASDFIL
jgi:Ca2+-binding RTX toxin-like protein